MRDRDSNIDLDIKDFKNHQKFYLEENKSYTITEMLDKWQQLEIENEDVLILEF